ncbi:MAG: siderophore-interacting protein [Arachnia sp.]
MTTALPTSAFFRVRVSAIADITPTFRRFTLTGDDVAHFGDPGFDQRIKVVFPTPEAGLDAMPVGDDWYLQWRSLPEDRRPPFRTYTTRYVRAEQRELDVDMVAHDVLGPASDWIARARVGDELLVFGPTTAQSGVSFGIDFVPPARADRILLAGDETAAPAIAAILEQLPADARGEVVVELPHADDAAYFPRHPGFEVRAAARPGGRHEHLIPAVRDAALRLAPPGEGSAVEEVDIDTDILWEVPRTAKGGAALKSAPLYAWLAGEAGAIKALRRHLVSELGVDRRAVAFMGYWRLGRAEN